VLFEPCKKRPVDPFGDTSVRGAEAKSRLVGPSRSTPFLSLCLDGGGNLVEPNWDQVLAKVFHLGDSIDMCGGQDAEPEVVSSRGGTRKLKEFGKCRR
jgi:hypothetical protein